MALSSCAACMAWFRIEPGCTQILRSGGNFGYIAILQFKQVRGRCARTRWESVPVCSPQRSAGNAGGAAEGARDHVSKQDSTSQQGGKRLPGVDGDAETAGQGDGAGATAELGITTLGRLISQLQTGEIANTEDFADFTVGTDGEVKVMTLSDLQPGRALGTPRRDRLRHGAPQHRRRAVGREEGNRGTLRGYPRHRRRRDLCPGPAGFGPSIGRCMRRDAP